MNYTIRDIYTAILLWHSQYRTQLDGTIEVLLDEDQGWQSSVWFLHLRSEAR